MSEGPNSVNCAAFRTQLPELIDSGENVAAHPHLENCGHCGDLVTDLETIAGAARQLFPVVEPPENLWTQIESAIRGGRGSVETG